MLIENGGGYSATVCKQWTVTTNWSFQIQFIDLYGCIVKLSRLNFWVLAKQGKPATMKIMLKGLGCHNSNATLGHVEKMYVGKVLYERLSLSQRVLYRRFALNANS